MLENSIQNTIDDLGKLYDRCLEIRSSEKDKEEKEVWLQHLLCITSAKEFLSQYREYWEERSKRMEQYKTK